MIFVTREARRAIEGSSRNSRVYVHHVEDHRDKQKLITPKLRHDDEW
jgi:hypothetical protein